MSSSFKWNENLTGTALDIASSNSSSLRVLAGPGTGKTFSMMRRVARLLEQGVDPQKILVCTFTRTAAHDLKTALTKLGVEGADRVIASTLHSYCFLLLSKSQVLTVIDRNPRPLLAFEERFLLEDLKADEFGGVNQCQRRLNAFNAAWARLQSEQPGWPKNVIDQSFHQQLMSWLRFHRSILIGELVTIAHNYLRDNPTSEFKCEFAHVLVDEYQDLNRADQALIDLLTEESNVIVIGDEDQSIYSFRYANPEGIANYNEEHQGTQDLLLDNCRRCPKLVVNIANSLISNNENRTVRSMTPFNDNTNGTIKVVQWQSLQEEAEGLAVFIKEKIEKKEVTAGKILVLSPRRQLGYSIRDQLMANGVTAHSFFQEEELAGDPRDSLKCLAQQAFSLLALLADTNDSVALRCYCGFGHSTLRRVAWSKLRKHCEKSGDSPISALVKFVKQEIEINGIETLREPITTLQQKIEQFRPLRGQDLIDALFPVEIKELKLLRSIAQTCKENATADVLLNHVRNNIAQPELPTDVDYVRIMSLHKSKGLTADLVVIVGCMEGLTPFIDDTTPYDEQIRQLEEQRRLFYVAITRTTNTLVLSSISRLPLKIAHKIRAKAARKDGTDAITVTSRFVHELGSQCPRAITGSVFLASR